MLGTLTPLGAGRNRPRTGFRSDHVGRVLPVWGSAVTLRDSASWYLIDLSSVHGGTRTYTLDESKIHPANHEIGRFTLLVKMPAVNPPKVNLAFVDKWLDFGLFFRNEPGRTYLVSCFKKGGKWYAGTAGDYVQPVTRRAVERSVVFTGATVPLADDCRNYRTAVTGPTTFVFDTSGLTTEKPTLSFDLILDFDDETPLADVVFPVSKWFDFGMPFRPWTRGRHVVTFVTLDGGDNWLGKINY